MNQLMKIEKETIFNKLVEGINIDEYISKFEDKKNKMVENYILIKRCKRRMNNESTNILYKNPEKEYMPSIVSLKLANKRLESEHWRSLLEERKLFILMSYVEKTKWIESIENLDVPDFNKKNLISVMSDIINSSGKFFAERICLALESLSKDHVTNSQFGFGEKIIIKGIHEGFSTKYLYPSTISSKIGALDEIRKIVCFLSTGNITDLEERMSTESIVSKCISLLRDERRSEFYIDNGRISLKIFKVGTAHLSITPEIADRMNSFVSILYPNKLPSNLKEAKIYKGAMKKQVLETDSISQCVLSALDSLRFVSKKLMNEINREKANELKENTYMLAYTEEKILREKGKYKEFLSIINKIGGKQSEKREDFFEFKYKNVNKVVRELIIAGGIDNQSSYQQYYTKEVLANDAYDLLMEDYKEEDMVDFNYLEPSCGGIDGLMRLMPKERVKGIDISRINIAMRKEQGYNVELNDFMSYAKSSKEKYNVIMLNPPFKKNQAYNHTMAAYTLLKEEGSLVAILPSTLKGSFDHLNSDSCKIFNSEIYKSDFEDTDCSVFILKIKKD